MASSILRILPACAVSCVLACGGAVASNSGLDAGASVDGSDSPPGHPPPPDFDGSFPPPPPFDGGRFDGGRFDGGPNPPDAGLQKHAKVQVINAATTAIGAARYCPGVGIASDGSDTSVAPVPALPHDDAHPMPGTTWPGIPIGTAATLPDLTDLSTKAITGFVVVADRIKGDVKSNVAERTCDQLIGPRGAGGDLVLGTDYFRLPTIPAGTFTRGASFAVAFYDCNAGASFPLACTSVGPLAGSVFHLDTSVANSPADGLSVIHLSTPLWTATSNGVELTHENCAVPTPVTTLTTNAKFASQPSMSTLINVFVGNPCETVRFVVRRADTTVSFTSNPQSVARVAALSNGVAFVPSANYTLVVLGDPGAPEASLVSGASNPSYDGRGVHVIALANDPALPPL